MPPFSPVIFHAERAERKWKKEEEKRKAKNPNYRCKTPSITRAGDIYLVLEYVDNDLHAFLNHRYREAKKRQQYGMVQPLSEKEVKVVMLQILQGVEYLHKHLIVHR